MSLLNTIPMRNSAKYILLVGLVMMLNACDKDFDELNTNPVRLTSIDGTFQLNFAIIQSAPVYNNLTYETTIVRQMITPFTGVGTGANLNQDNRSATQNNWQRGYRNVLKNLIDAIASEELKEAPNTNLLSMLKIWKSHAFMVMTDTYGDVPYSEASRAFLDGNSFPIYDSQESIYNALLDELASAAGALDPGKGAVTQDVLYGGDIDQWKRLGYSLMLRAAMRLVKVNPGKAQEFAAKAIAGGIIQSNADNAVVRHNADFRNPVGTNLNGGQAPFYYLDEEFVNYLADRNDPRLPVIGVRYVGAMTEGDQTEENADRTSEAQIGMPQGFDNSSIPPVIEAAGLASLYDYTQLDRSRLGNPEAPSFLVTYAQTQLLLAEAIVRGWTTGDAAGVYASAIEANMQQMSAWPGDTDIAQEDIDAYVTANPLDAGAEIEQINGQYWIASLLNGPEAWANFRRSGFPDIKPNPYPGTDLKTEDFIRRLTYPDSELTVNRANVEVALSRQGADALDTRVWWDVN